MFGEDACVKRPDNYKNSLPEHEKSEEFLKVLSLDDDMEHFLIKRHPEWIHSNDLDVCLLHI